MYAGWVLLPCPIAGQWTAGGTFETLNANGTFSFMPLLNFFGTVYFTYKLVDGNVPPPPENLPVGFTVSDFNSVFLNPNGSASSPPESNVATVAIDVTPVNDVPVSPDLDLDVPEDSQVVEIGHLLSDVFDPDNETWTLTPVLVTWPTHGTVSISGQGSIVYTPYPGFVGEDEFTFIIGDGEGWSDPVTGSVDSAGRSIPASLLCTMFA